MRAATGIISPWILTSVAPSTSSRPRVPSAWKPTNSTVFRGSGSASFRWCRTRPPVAIPLDEMTMHGKPARMMSFDCCGEVMAVKRPVGGASPCTSGSSSRRRLV